ncbi:MAG: hypothetical protein LBQ48_06390 [Oscillospiraceae bacterium]|nr:hypothetical protein [Oscillospiraceae bacterium]
MKIKRILITGALLAFVSCLLFSTAAQTVKFKKQQLSVAVPEGYLILNKKNSTEHKELIKRLGFTVSSFNQRFNTTTTDTQTDTLLLFAVTPDGRRQINLKLTENEFSAGVYDLSTLTSEQRQTALDKLLESVEKNAGRTLLTWGEHPFGGAVFYSVTVMVHATRDFCYQEYFTVMNGKYLALTVYNNAASFSEEERLEAESVFASLSFHQSAGLDEQKDMLPAVLGGLVLAAAAVLILFISFTLIRDLVRHHAGRFERSERLNHKYKKHFGPKRRV